MNKNKDIKYDRMRNFDTKKINNIKAKSLEILTNSKSEKDKMEAAIVFIIANTGLRIGNSVGFGITENRGVSTLHSKNIKISGDKVSFNFTGKSYVENVSSVNNKHLAEFLTKLKSERSKEQFIFNTTYKKIQDFFENKLDMKGFKLKDMRTFIATEVAIKELKKDKEAPPPVPKSKILLKKLVNQKIKRVSTIVGEKLNNSPAMAKNSYIHPDVIDNWLKSLNIDKKDLESVKKKKEIKKAEDDNEFKKSNNIDMNEDDLDFCDEYLLPDYLLYDESENMEPIEKAHVDRKSTRLNSSH